MKRKRQRIIRTKYIVACFLAANITVGTVSAIGATLLGPSPYVKRADSPFPLSHPSFQLKNFENGSLNVTGVTLSSPTGIGISDPTNMSHNPDSVDEDEGGVDGFGGDGRNLGTQTPERTDPPAKIEFVFDAVALGGRLPTHVGIVWTDGGPLVTDSLGNIKPGTGAPAQFTFEVFDESLTSLGTLTETLGDGMYTGETAEDRFFGAIHSSGIGKFTFQHNGAANAKSYLELDHLQFGIIPEPSTAILALLGVLGVVGYRWQRRRQQPNR